jgi:DNA-directed RNA polymerase subunit H
VVESDLNVLEHDLVPEHTLLSEQEAEQVLAKLKITRDQLPKIRKDDACIRLLERIEGPINPGRIIRSEGESETARSS